MQVPPPVRPGTGIKFPIAVYERLRAFAMSLRLISGPGILAQETAGGTIVSLDLPTEFPIRITARTGTDYAWNRLVPTSGGGWSDDTTSTGTTTRDPAREANGVVAATPQVVWARRVAPYNAIVFDRDTCS